MDLGREKGKKEEEKKQYLQFRAPVMFLLEATVTQHKENAEEGYFKQHSIKLTHPYSKAFASPTPSGSPPTSFQKQNCFQIASSKMAPLINS